MLYYNTLEISREFSEIIAECRDNFEIVLYTEISLVMKNTKLVNNYYSDEMNNKFNPKSDIDTIVKTLTPLFEFELDEASEKAEEMGFNKQIFMKVYSKVVKRINDIYNGNKKDFVTRVMTTDLSPYIFRYIEKLEKYDDSYQDKHVFEVKSVKCMFDSREVLLESVDGTQLIVSRRPGWKGLSVPKKCYVFSITTFKDKKFGSIIQATKDSQEYAQTVDITENCINNPFFNQLVISYVGKDNFIPIYVGNRGQTREIIIDERSKVISVVLKENINFKLVVTNIMSIMKYVPRSVVLQYPKLSMLVEIYNHGVNNYIKKAYLPNECPNAYAINRNILDYIFNNINLLSGENPQVRFAITGEGFCYSLDDRHVTNNVNIPFIQQQTDKVFINDKYATQNFVLLVNRGVRMNGRQLNMNCNEQMVESEGRKEYSPQMKLKQRVLYESKGKYVVLSHTMSQISAKSLDYAIKNNGKCSGDYYNYNIKQLILDYENAFINNNQMNGTINLKRIMYYSNFSKNERIRRSQYLNVFEKQVVKG